MKIRAKCLAFNAKDNKGAAYTSDGYMLPCCWLDDPPVHRYVVDAGLKDDELLLSKNEKLEDIFRSDQWENFFQTLLKKPECASYMCKKKCGVDIDKSIWHPEERIESKAQYEESVRIIENAKNN